MPGVGALRRLGRVLARAGRHTDEHDALATPQPADSSRSSPFPHGARKPRLIDVRALTESDLRMLAALVPIALRLLLTREERDMLAAGGLLRQAAAGARPLV